MHNNAIKARAKRARTGPPRSGGAPAVYGGRYVQRKYDD